MAKARSPGCKITSVDAETRTRISQVVKSQRKSFVVKITGNSNTEWMRNHLNVCLKVHRVYGAVYEAPPLLVCIV